MYAIRSYYVVVQNVVAGNDIKSELDALQLISEK